METSDHKMKRMYYQEVALNLVMMDTQNLELIVEGRLYKVAQLPVSDHGAYAGGKQGGQSVVALNLTGTWEIRWLRG